MAGERRVITLGGKGFSISSSSVFELATASPPPVLKLDLSALSSRKPDPKLSPIKIQLSVPELLTPEEVRASIVLLLYKLLLGGPSLATTASQLLDVENSESGTGTIDLDFDRKEDAELMKEQK